MREDPYTKTVEPLLFTVPEVCEALRVSRWQFYRLVNEQRLKTVRINRRRFVAPADLNQLIEDLRSGGEHGG
ncbi:hypothetical protein GCM10027059_41810 [Myceligenerans halotolerans]